MNLNELASLSLVRGHLAALLGNRAVVHKDQVKSLGKILSELDRKFLEQILVNFANEQSVTVTNGRSKLTTTATEVKIEANTITVVPLGEKPEQSVLGFVPPATVVVEAPPDKPAEAPVKKAKAKKAKEEDPEIAARVAKAKAEVAKKKATSTFKRVDSEE